MSRPIKHTPLDKTKQQRSMELVQHSVTPYFLIAVFALAVATIRVYMLPEWCWYHHLFSFVGQFVFMTVIWLFIKWLNRKLERVIPFAQGPGRRMFIQVMIVLALLLPLIYLSIHYSKPYLPPFVNKEFLMVVVMTFVVIIILFNFSFYAAHFFKNWQMSVEEKAMLEVQTAELEKEKFNLQYHQLRNQVNPHYLFNTLTSLDSLIQRDPQLASQFVQHMSKVYRYVLQHQENEVVSLEKEVDFIGHYIELLHVRYQDGLNIHLTISEAAKEMGIVMVTMQMLIDNAIKHNVVQSSDPLKIIIWDEDGYLVFYNNKNLRKQIETSNKKGLVQLRQLYSYLSEQPIVVLDEADHFTIKIPLLEL